MTTTEINTPIGHPYSTETPRYLGSVKQRPYTTAAIVDRNTGETTRYTHESNGVWDYWAYRDGVYSQWRSTVDNEVGALRAYSAWSQWHTTNAARTLYGDNAIDETRKTAFDKVPTNY